MKAMRETDQMKIAESVVVASNAITRQFQNAAFDFLYEADIQAALFALLRALITDVVEIPSLTKGKPAYKLQVVYSEYNHRIDIACIDPIAAKNKERKAHKGLETYIYNLPVSVGIEIKYGTMGKPINFDDCLGDLKKLQVLEVAVPHVMGFIQETADVDKFMASVPAGWCFTNAEKVSGLGQIYIVTPCQVLVFTQKTSALAQAKPPEGVNA